MKHVFRIWFLGVTTIFAILALGAATYAWFTSNRAVSTSTASARTGEETLELQLSSRGGSRMIPANMAPNFRMKPNTVTNRSAIF